jgi:hypothetical protein
MAEFSQLFFATLGSNAVPHAVTGGVCYCCKTAIATGPAGEIYLAWRHVYPGNLRDIAFSVSRDGGRLFSPPVRVSEDHWAIEGCPEDGPSLAVDPQGRVHVIWPTVVTENGEPVKALFHAMTREGRTFTARTRIPASGQANHPQLAVARDGSLAVAWDESGNGSRRIAFARGTVAANEGATFRRVSEQLEPGTYPVVSAVGGGDVLAAWVNGEPSKSVIRFARIK